MSFTFIDASNYFLNPFAVPVLIVSTLLSLIGIFVLSQNPKAASNVSFFIICVMSCIWLYGISLVYCSRSELLAVNWYKYFTFFGVTQIAPSIYFFSTAWTGLLAKRKKWVAVGYLLAFIFFLSSSFTSYGIVGVRKYFWGLYPIYGPIAQASVVFFVIYYSMALGTFVAGRRYKTISDQLKQYNFMMAAYIITFFGACDFIPKFAAIPLYPFGYITVLLWLSIVAYSIIRYKVMEIETVIHKTLMWAALSSVVFFPLGFIFYRFRDLFVYLHQVFEWFLKYFQKSF